VSLEDRKLCIKLVNEAHNAGARRKSACNVLGLSLRTLQRWEGNPRPDQRKGAHRYTANALSNEEKKVMLQIANSSEYRDYNPHQIVARLADEGRYIASERSFYRLLREHKLLAHRSKSKPRTSYRPRSLTATKPNEVWSWDITYLLSTIKGKYYYLYMVEDIYSRMIIGFCVEEYESSDISSDLIERCCINQDIPSNQVSLHSDNGSPMKGATMLSTLQRLGVIPSFSRPRVSNDNPYSESLFKTLKYCPQYPSKPFCSLQEAHAWVDNFTRWYNTRHLHSEIRFVTPHARHYGIEKEILEKRDILYKKHQTYNPIRWSQTTRNWNPAGPVTLNPGKERKTLIKGQRD
jgi:transposase InsO family protein